MRRKNLRKVTWKACEVMASAPQKNIAPPATRAHSIFGGVFDAVHIPFLPYKENILFVVLVRQQMLAVLPSMRDMTPAMSPPTISVNGSRFLKPTGRPGSLDGGGHSEVAGPIHQKLGFGACGQARRPKPPRRLTSKPHCGMPPHRRRARVAEEAKGGL